MSLIWPEHIQELERLIENEGLKLAAMKAGVEVMKESLSPEYKAQRKREAEFEDAVRDGKYPAS